MSEVVLCLWAKRTFVDEVVVSSLQDFGMLKIGGDPRP